MKCLSCTDFPLFPCKTLMYAVVKRCCTRLERWSTSGVRSKDGERERERMIHARTIHFSPEKQIVRVDRSVQLNFIENGKLFVAPRGVIGSSPSSTRTRVIHRAGKVFESRFFRKGEGKSFSRLRNKEVSMVQKIFQFHCSP